MQGLIDNRGDVQGKYHYSLTDSLILKSQVQVSRQGGYNMLQLEGDYLGSDFSVNVRAINGNPATGTGIFTASYLQSITKRLSLGIEGVLQRPTADVEEADMSLVGRFVLQDAPSPAPSAGVDESRDVAPLRDPTAVVTVTLQNMAAVQASYYQRFSDQLELASEVQAVFVGGEPEALASVGCKIDYRQASIRAHVDSQAKMCVFLEERLPIGRMALLISGELDHLKGKNKFGVGLSVEN